MRVRIVSDGSPGGTRVEVSDDTAPIPVWHPLPKVIAVDWHLDAGRGTKAVAKITLSGVAVELEADAEVASPPKRLFDRTAGPGKEGSV